MFGQPSRGLTILKRESAKLPIARAAIPMFSPSCGSTRITTGPARSWPDFVLSVPDPDITSLSDSTSDDFESGSEEDLMQRLGSGHLRLPVRQRFSSEFIGLVAASEFQSKAENCSRAFACLRAFAFRIRYQSQPKRTCKANQKAKSEGRFNGPGKRDVFMRRRW